jgi:hypothetical protein
VYASVQRYERVAGTTDRLALAGRQLASLLSRQPGFISFVVLEAREGGFTSISFFDDEPSLEQANRLAAGWIGENLGGVLSAPAPVATGEVIAQEGL